MTNKEKLIKWLQNPNTNPDAWKIMTLQEICDKTGLNYTAVHRNLVSATAAHTGKTPKTIADERKQHAFEKGDSARRLSTEQKKQMEHLRFKENMNLTEIAIETGIGYGTVQQHFKKLQTKQKK